MEWHAPVAPRDPDVAAPYFMYYVYYEGVAPLTAPSRARNLSPSWDSIRLTSFAQSAPPRSCAARRASAGPVTFASH
jgi:hypothetical protein